VADPRVVRIDAVPRLPADIPAGQLDLMFGQLCSVLGDRFSAARSLIALLERSTGEMSALDQQHISRLMSASAHSILLRAEKLDKQRW
jgi:hypothetical protein